MVRERMRRYRRRLVDELHRSFGEEYSPTQIARSFAIGVFITMLPTLGVGLLVFVALAYLFDWINKIALFASVLVLNPAVKWAVYAGSMGLGVLLLGPVEGGLRPEATPAVAQALLVRLLVGNAILAVIATILGYVIVHGLATRYQAPIKDTVDVVIDEVLEPTEPGDSDS